MNLFSIFLRASTKNTITLYPLLFERDDIALIIMMLWSADTTTFNENQ